MVDSTSLKQLTDQQLLDVARNSIEILRRRGWDVRLGKVDQSGSLTATRKEQLK